MALNPNDQIFIALEKKVSELVSSHIKLRQENEKLRTERKALREQIDNQKETIKNFQNQNNFGNIVNALAGDEADKEKLRKTLDEFILEVNRCISYLNE